MSLEFLVTALIVVLMPGTGALYTVSMGLTRGPRAAVLAALGCTLGIVPHIFAAMAGLAALLSRSAEAFAIVQWAGVAYLLYMAVTMLRGSGGIGVSAEPAGAGLRIIARAVFINLFNPKLSLFFLAFLPQFVSPQAPDALARMTLDSLVFMGLTAAVFILYGLFAARLRRHVIDRPKVLAWISRAFAAGFLGMGVKLALAER